MRTLVAEEIIRVWELGQDRPTLQRALLLLAPCFPESRPSELAAMPLARRNRLLLELRERMIGPTLACFVLCPACGAPLEFSATVQELLARQPDLAEIPLTVEVEGRTVPYRTPDSQDLAAAAEFVDVPEAAETLLRRSASSAVAVDAAVEEAIAQAVERDAPLTDIRIPLRCASAEHVWSASLDIAAFLWIEIDRIATRLLDEVQSLARAYGWQESEILAMSDGRRRFYLGAIDA